MYTLPFGERDPVAEPGTSTGTPGDWWTVWANSPDVLEHAVAGFALYASPDRKIAPALRELGQIPRWRRTQSSGTFVGLVDVMPGDQAVTLNNDGLDHRCG